METDVDVELDRLMARRASEDRGPGPEEREEPWRASVAAHNARRRREARALWYAHFCRMAESHARLSEDYERRAEALCCEATEGGR